MVCNFSFVWMFLKKLSLKRENVNLHHKTSSLYFYLIQTCLVKCKSCSCAGFYKNEAHIIYMNNRKTIRYKKLWRCQLSLRQKSNNYYKALTQRLKFTSYRFNHTNLTENVSKYEFKHFSLCSEDSQCRLSSCLSRYVVNMF